MKKLRFSQFQALRSYVVFRTVGDGGGGNIFSARSLLTDQKTSQKSKGLESLSNVLPNWMSNVQR